MMPLVCSVVRSKQEHLVSFPFSRSSPRQASPIFEPWLSKLVEHHWLKSSDNSMEWCLALTQVYTSAFKRP